MKTFSKIKMSKNFSRVTSNCNPHSRGGNSRTIPNAGRYFVSQSNRPLNDKRPLYDKQPNTVYVDFIHQQVTEEILYELFLNVGPLISVVIHKNPPKHFAFIKFQHEESVRYSILLLRDVVLFGQKIRVQEAFATPRKGPDPSGVEIRQAVSPSSAITELEAEFKHQLQQNVQLELTKKPAPQHHFDFSQLIQENLTRFRNESRLGMDDSGYLERFTNPPNLTNPVIPEIPINPVLSLGSYPKSSDFDLPDSDPEVIFESARQRNFCSRKFKPIDNVYGGQRHQIQPQVVHVDVPQDLCERNLQRLGGLDVRNHLAELEHFQSAGHSGISLTGSLYEDVFTSPKDSVVNQRSYSSHSADAYQSTTKINPFLNEGFIFRDENGSERTARPNQRQLFDACRDFGADHRLGRQYHQHNHMFDQQLQTQVSGQQNHMFDQQQNHVFDEDPHERVVRVGVKARLGKIPVSDRNDPKLMQVDPFFNITLNRKFRNSRDISGSNHSIQEPCLNQGLAQNYLHYPNHSNFNPSRAQMISGNANQISHGKNSSKNNKRKKNKPQQQQQKQQQPKKKKH